MASNNLGIWVPTFFVRVHGMSLLAIGTAAGIVSIVVGIPAMVLAGNFSDRFSRVFGGGRMAFTAATALASVLLWVALLFINQLAALVADNVVLYALAIMWVGPATADVHEITGPCLRGLGISASSSRSSNIVAYGVGAPLIGPSPTRSAAPPIPTPCASHSRLARQRARRARCCSGWEDELGPRAP